MMSPERAESVKGEFDRQGYVAVRGFLDAGEVEEVQGQVARYLAEVVPRITPRDVYREVPGDDRSIKQLIRMNQYDEYFGALLSGGRFVELAELLLGGPV